MSDDAISHALTNAKRGLGERINRNAAELTEAGKRGEAGLVPRGEMSAIERIKQRWDLDDSQVEAVKATYVQTRGNLSATAKEHGLSPHEVRLMSQDGQWKVYGLPITSQEKATRSRIEQMADTLTVRTDEMLDSLTVEYKALEDMTDKGMSSHYVASLAQRTTAFTAMFDRLMRLLTILNPEEFVHDPAVSNTYARKAETEKIGADEVGRMIGAMVGEITKGSQHVDQPYVDATVRTPSAGEVGDGG